MKHAWFGFLALLSAVLFLWLATEQMAPTDTQVQVRHLTTGEMVSWDYRHVAFERSSIAPATGTLGIDDVTLIPVALLILATGILPIIWLTMKLVDLHSAHFIRRDLLAQI